MAFFASAITTLQTLVIALGAGLGVWGVVNLLEGYGSDNPGSNVRSVQLAVKYTPPTTIAEELKRDLEDVANFKGSPLEKQAALYCKRLGINYNKLSDVEFRQLVHILEKSKFFKSYVSQRKKRK